MESPDPHKFQYNNPIPFNGHLKSSLAGGGHAIYTAKEFLKNTDDLFIYFGDTLVDMDFEKIINCPTSCFAVKKVDAPGGFGIVEFYVEGNVKRVVEKPKIPKSNMAIVGLYRIKEVAELLDALEKNIHNNIKSEGEFSLTDALMRMIEKGISFTGIEVENWYDCGKKETLLTKGEHDMMAISLIDEKNNAIYYQSTSPDKATQLYLYRVSLDGKGEPEVISPEDIPGTHQYNLSPNGRYARYRFSNYFTRSLASWISLPDHKPLPGQQDVREVYDPSAQANSRIEYFKVTSEEGVTMDAWIAKPYDFDPSKKYPVVFQVYAEPAGATVKDSWQPYRDFLYAGDMAADGYIHISVDNRGTPAPKGRAWRKAIYRNIGQLNIRDQALAAKEILKAPYMDTSRVASWGWSGGGSTTLNLLFQYPEIYKTGIAIAPVTSSLLYDNIYTERYMGLPQENMADYLAGAALTHAKNLQGHLLLVHGTNDDNVHFQNSEMLVNELVKHNKQFQYMAYPGRSHGLREGDGTLIHLTTMATEFLRQYCPPGGR